MQNELIRDNLDDLEFRGVWRSYQKRVLNELDEHLSDSKLNVVAAPGAGKTTLGIEVLKRLNNPALIFAPTITIKNQWKQRIIDHFLIDKSNSSLISVDLKNISTITVSTYQALHSLFKEKEASEKLLEDIKKYNIKTLVLDEAHHLRVEWWLTLSDLVQALNGKLKIVSLTGTPPYDVPPNEWKNYNELCGPVDAEISIPELVKTGDLCPHQDLVYFSSLTEEEKNIVFDFEQKRDEFFDFLNKNVDFHYSIISSPFVDKIEKKVELIYQNTNFTVSIISYLLNYDELSIEARVLCEFLGLDVSQIPKFDYKMAQVLFNNIFGDFEKHFKRTALVKNKLKELKLINGKKVDFVGNTDFKKLFARSKNKLDAIYDISKFEYAIQKEDLREVILLDYIGKGDSEGLNILSVFDKLHNLNIKLGILTGTLIVIPKEAKEKLYLILEEKKIEKEKVLVDEFNSKYLRVETYGELDIVSVVTKLFELGYINILVGTAALLGEGWDSPSVNTLIIASVVGSYMLSNQMRGRALRINKNKLDKTSNIWHLVSLDSDYLTNQDFLTIEKRFNTFEGISYCDEKIQNGLFRLDLDYDLIEKNDCAQLNKKTFEYAKKRNELKEKWQQVFKKSSITEKTMVSQIYNVVEGDETQRSVVVKDIPKWLSFTENIANANSFHTKKKDSLFANKLMLKILNSCNLVCDDWEYILNDNYQKYVQQENLKNIANALLKTLCDIGKIKTNYSKMNFVVNTEMNTKFFMTLTGSSNYERNLFVNALEEIFKIDDSSRYILRKDDKYIGVPECIGVHGKNVDKFIRNLEPSFGFLSKIYTRNPVGYKELLKAKYNTMKFCEIKNSRVWI